jgi:hypothetical protein
MDRGELILLKVKSMGARPATTSSTTAQRRRLRHATPQAIAVATRGYAQLLAWRQDHLPWLHDSGGAALFFTLAAAVGAVPIADLCRGADASPSKVRRLISELRRTGLVRITVDSNDRRRQLVEATDLFRRLARSYMQMIILLLR